MANNSNYKEISYSNLVNCRDFRKIDTNFEEPNLLKMQRDSYQTFLKTELEKIILNYSPIKHAKNNRYEVHFDHINFAKPTRSEEECRNKCKNYEQALYVDAYIIDNKSGEKITVKKENKGLTSGIFFANIPVMTEKGTFIINGIEKFVVSQILRAPGVYISNKSQIKLNNKKHISYGYACELLPSRGTLINFMYNEDLQIINALVRNSQNDAIVEIPATILLKAFGMTQDEIRKVFNDDLCIINTLFNECSKSKDKTWSYTHNGIMQNPEIVEYRVQIEESSQDKSIGKGSPIDTRLKKYIKKVVNCEAEIKALDDRYEKLYLKNKEDYESLKKELANANQTEKKKIQSKISFIETEFNKILDAKDELTKKLREYLDTVITEKAAKDLISKFSISTRSVESDISSKDNPICYQDVIVSHFMDPRKYELSNAGRYRTLHKMRISDRLYQRVISEDILYKNNKVFLKKGTLIGKEELASFKKAAENQDLNITYEVKLPYKNKILNNQCMNIECVNVYTNNDQQVEWTAIIGEFSNDERIAKCYTLSLVDFIACISYTMNLPHGIGRYDDIDHLGNKRLRLIGEQLKSKLQIGMVRIEKQIKDKLSSVSIATANEEQQEKFAKNMTPSKVINTKAFQFAVKNFFNTYQLTQFVDQQNPLSELSNKRRISAMGDGGISREDPNLDIRDVHYSQYGRICPIETPEGMNIGLIMSLASFTQIDKNGFLVSPYHPVKNGVIQQDVEWLTPIREDNYAICEATIPHDEKGKILVKSAICRFRASQQELPVSQIDYVDIAPRQVVSIAASAIPFLEHDDTTRALMGANMQRQAVPLLQPYAPIVGTGTEYKIAHDSGLTIVSKNPGVVESIDGNKISIRNELNRLDNYPLIKYHKSNQNTCINQTPIVTIGQRVKENVTLADGPAMYNGQLALGRNPLVAFTTWNGYNYEDAIVVSERLVRDDVYTSITIEEYTINCLRTNNGDEEITRDLNNVSEDAKRYLDEDGIIMVGAEVHEGDILVGKQTPRGQNDFTPEEKLLQAIFGNKTKNYRESSLKVPHGGDGIVAKVQRFSIVNGDELDDDVIESIKIFIVQKRKIQIGDKMSGRHGNKGCISIVAPVADMPFMEDGTPIDICLNPLGVPSRMNIGQVFEMNLGLSMRALGQQKAIEFVLNSKSSTEAVKLFTKEFGIPTEKAKVLVKSISKYCKQNHVETLEEAKRKISYNDILLMVKNAGLDIEILNYKAITPVFCGAELNDVINNIKEAGFATNDKSKIGKFQLYDGKTGEPFDNLTTVGVMYMMKLDHMVDDKIHARAVGPYSKITQQPLGGKSQNGGQRFGEMEVWALEAYGAAHNLQEILTIKSDDVKGRNGTYSAIVKGRKIPEPGLPETFKLLSKQLQGLALNMTVINNNGEIEDINSYTAISDDDEEKQNETQTGIASINDFDVNNNNDDENYY